jgi:hypothetical protein
MNTASPTDDALAEVWAIKDSLSATLGHDLQKTCRLLYAEQEKHPEKFVNLGGARTHKSSLSASNVTAVVAQANL